MTKSSMTKVRFGRCSINWVLTTSMLFTFVMLMMGISVSAEEKCIRNYYDCVDNLPCCNPEFSCFQNVHAGTTLRVCAKTNGHVEYNYNPFNLGKTWDQDPRTP